MVNKEKWGVIYIANKGIRQLFITIENVNEGV
jgi:hypothetical protein